MPARPLFDLSRASTRTPERPFSPRPRGAKKESVVYRYEYSKKNRYKLMAVLEGLGRARKALLGLSLVLTLVGCALCWHVQQRDAHPTLLHRSHDYFLAGYVFLWLSHMFAARVRQDPSV